VAEPSQADSAGVSADGGKGRATKDYGRGAAILTVGIGITGLVTFAFLAVASNLLSKELYGQLALLWSAVFLITPVFYRPVEQLMARTIAERRTRDQELLGPLRIAAVIQLALGALFAVVALAFRTRITDGLFDGSDTLFWIMFSSVLGYAVSYFGRGLLAGFQRFGLYGLLVFVESTVRFMFPLAVLAGFASGQDAIALGILAGPLVSLLVVPAALLGRSTNVVGDDPMATADDVVEEMETLDVASGASNVERTDFTLTEGTGFAAAALVIMACEQTILNAAPFIANSTVGGAAAAAMVVNILLIARAPMQLFQSIATSLLPHLSSLRATGDFGTYRRSVRLTLLAIAGAAGAGAVVMAAIGPWLMQTVLGDEYVYGRAGLVAVTLGMGLYLCAATLNQSALAAGRIKAAVACWLTATAAFVTWLLLPFHDSALTRVEIGYPASALLLFVLLFALYERSTPRQ
jgi:O-antigen/teichoic acid export membrane protein